MPRVSEVWRLRAQRLEPVLVTLIALHSLAVGVLLTFAPEWAATFGGFGVASPLFFPRQAGAFHLVVAAGYLGELRLYGGVRLLVTTKTIAFLFLTAAWLGGEPAWSVPLSALADGAMGAAVALVRHTATSGAAAASS